MDQKYRLFKRGQTVVDLGYAPGSWSQVARGTNKAKWPGGRDRHNSRATPKGVSAIQGNFLDPGVQNLVKLYLADADHREQAEVDGISCWRHDGLVAEKPSYIDAERSEADLEPEVAHEDSERLVDIVISDMSDPWAQTSGFGSNTLSNPYHRMMNTSGMRVRDHVGSMDLCFSALRFASDTLRTGGHFVCKFYQGSEDKELEKELKKMFGKVYREKPESSRNESKEAYLVALRRRAMVTYVG